MKRRINALLTGALLVTALTLGAVPGPALAGEGRPLLYGHGFVESADVPSPFVRTFVRNRLGAGKALDLQTTIDDIDGTPILGLKGDLIFAILDFEYQYAVKPWLGLRARVVASGRLGSDTQALLAEGVTMATGFEFGWLVRLHERERTALALDLAMSNRAFTSANLVAFVEDIVNGREASLTSKTPSARGSVGLRYGWAASPLVGVLARVATGYGESVSRADGDEWFYRLSTAVDFDLRAKTPAPVGIALGYSYDTFPEFGDDIAEGVHSPFVRFSYLGREDFLFSLDFSFDQIPMAGDRPDLKATSITVNMRYYI